MAAQSVTELPEDDDWLYEIKLDGYRALLLKNGAPLMKRRAKLASIVTQDPTLRLSQELPGSGADVVKAVRAARPPESWTRSELLAQIRFVEWTAEGRLRHAAFLGVREDKSANEVRREGICRG